VAIFHAKWILWIFTGTKMTNQIRLFVFFLALIAAGVAIWVTRVDPGVKASAEGVELNTLEQRFSYAAGYTFAKQMTSQPIQLEREVLISAIEDILDEKEPQMTVETMADTLAEARQHLAKLALDRMNKKLEDNKKFLAENKTKPGVTELPSGLQYIVIHAGEGESPATDSNVTVHYRGSFLDGREFDSSTRHGSEPVTFNLGRVVPGFREAISMMKPGGKWKVFMPSDLAYGPQGAPPTIGPNETLIFEIELISFAAPEKEEGAVAEKKDAG
jgi:FKBP-type peptidyl-prolyl cis-trans isomerase